MGDAGRVRGAPPEDFFDFVAGRVDRLYAAARTLTATEEAAAEMVTDLFGAAATRWRWLRSPDAAEDYVGRLFRRAVEAHGSPPRRYAPGAPVLLDAVAEAAWARGRGVQRRRVLAFAGGVGLLAAVPLVRRGPGGGAEDAAARPAASPSEGPDEAPAEVPLGIDLMPAADLRSRLPWVASPLPSNIVLSRPVGTLTTHPIGRALAAFRAPGSPLLLLGPDGLVREAPDPPGTESIQTTTPWPSAGTAAVGSAGAAAWPVRLTTTALSPDGTRLAQPTARGLSVLDVRTRTSREYASSERIRSVLWLGNQGLLLGRLTNSVLLSLESGRMRPAATGGRSTLHPRAGGEVPGPPRPVSVPAEPAALLRADGGASPSPAATQPAARDLPGAVELLPVGDPATAPARLRRHRATAAGVRLVDVALSGRLTGWVGLWRGVGFLTHAWALRDCTPMGRLPAAYPSPVLATVAVDPASGTVGRLLVTPGGDADPPQLLGVLNGGTAIIRARGAAGSLNLIAWRIATGRFSLISSVDMLAGVSLADLSAW
jgi:hypothetical protein